MGKKGVLGKVGFGYPALRSPVAGVPLPKAVPSPLTTGTAAFIRRGLRRFASLKGNPCWSDLREADTYRGPRRWRVSQVAFAISGAQLYRQSRD